MEEAKSENIHQMTMIEYFWRNTYQLVGWEEEHSENIFPDVFGCGFVLKINDKFVFVTADHVIHKADEEAGARTNKEYRYAIVCNQNDIKNGSFQTIFRPIGGFISLDKFDLGPYLRGEEELEVALIPDMQDYAFADFKPEYFQEILTHELRINNDVLTREGLFHIFICEDAYTEPNENSKYMVVGTIPEPDKFDGIKWVRANAAHWELNFIGTEEGMYKFATSSQVKIEEWAGLSGAPFFDYDGNIVGMLLRAVEGYDFVWVMPIHTILKMINEMIRIGQL